MRTGDDCIEKDFHLFLFQGAGLIDGLHTNVVCMDYSNKLFIIVTQMEKLGTLVSVNP